MTAWNRSRFWMFVAAGVCAVCPLASQAATYQYQLLTAGGRPIRYLLDSPPSPSRRRWDCC